MDKPWLTKRRWNCLKAFQRQPHLMDRPFQAKELIICNRRGEWTFPASGAMVDSLRNAGWIEQVIVEPEKGLGFRVGGPVRMWQITDPGRDAVKACPDTFPGNPIYRKASK